MSKTKVVKSKTVVKPAKPRTRRPKVNPPPPPLPLTRHRLIPAILRELSTMLDHVDDPMCLDKIKVILDSEPPVFDRLVEFIDRVTFKGGDLPDDFDSRKFHFLLSLLAGEVNYVETDAEDYRVERMESDIEQCLQWIEKNWRIKKLTSAP